MQSSHLRLYMLRPRLILQYCGCWTHIDMLSFLPSLSSGTTMEVPTPKKEEIRPVFLPLISETRSARSEDTVFIQSPCACRLLRHLKEITNPRIIKASTPASTPIKAKRIFGAKLELAAMLIEDALGCGIFRIEGIWEAILLKGRIERCACEETC